MDIVLREKDAILYRDATNDESIGIKIIPSDHAAFSLEILDFGYTHDLEDPRDRILFESLPYDLMFTKPFFSEEESAALEGKTPTTSIKKADLIALLKKQDDYVPLVKAFVGDNPDYAERSAYLWQLTYAMFVRDAIAMDYNPFAPYDGDPFGGLMDDPEIQQLLAPNF
ncbi:MAG: hypothetical protein AAGI88_11590 [Pseudomonadota bacterium]